MLPQVKTALGKAVLKDMEDANVNWCTIQKINIKKDWGYPMGFITLHKLIRKTNYENNKQVRALLNHFKIPFNDNYGVITLVKESGYEQ